mmetsp:Transcript_63908/g.101318  ORF Transcript_63908/g.101318 Transcript_63908/m.101318 type:complete len:80 (-) Transcript_63908:194-433(-)
MQCFCILGRSEDDAQTGLRIYAVGCSGSDHDPVLDRTRLEILLCLPSQATERTLLMFGCSGFFFWVAELQRSVAMHGFN